MALKLSGRYALHTRLSVHTVRFRTRTLSVYAILGQTATSSTTACVYAQSLYCSYYTVGTIQQVTMQQLLLQLLQLLCCSVYTAITVTAVIIQQFTVSVVTSKVESRTIQRCLDQLELYQIMI
jgi:hypothetical protein